MHSSKPHSKAKINIQEFLSHKSKVKEHTLLTTSLQLRDWTLGDTVSPNPDFLFKLTTLQRYDSMNQQQDFSGLGVADTGQ